MNISILAYIHACMMSTGIANIAGIERISDVPKHDTTRLQSIDYFGSSRALLVIWVVYFYSIESLIMYFSIITVLRCNYIINTVLISIY